MRPGAPAWKTHAMLLDLTDRQAHALFGSMYAVATLGGTEALSEMAASAIESLAVVGLGCAPVDPGGLAGGTTDALGGALSSAEEAEAAVEILAVTSLVDGALDAGRIELVLDYAGALAVHEHWLEDLAASRAADLGPVIADMGGRNLVSISDGRVDPAKVDDIDAWLMPYKGDREDPALAARYRSLADADPATLGGAFFAFYDRHGFSFPGEPDAANEIFTTPHDCTHLLSGYDTTPQGALLVSTFTARMHPWFPMEGHILPVIYSWHLGIEFNSLAGSYRGALDPAKFWVAWDRGLSMGIDTFSEAFDFWRLADEPLEGLRDLSGVVALDPAFAASSDAGAGVDYRPIA